MNNAAARLHLNGREIELFVSFATTERRWWVSNLSGRIYSEGHATREAAIEAAVAAARQEAAVEADAQRRERRP